MSPVQTATQSASCGADIRGNSGYGCTVSVRGMSPSSSYPSPTTRNEHSTDYQQAILVTDAR